MTKEEIIDMAKEAGLAIGVALDGSKSVGKHEDKSFAVGRLPLDDFVAFVKLVAEKERASNHAYIYELERDLEVAQDKINDCLVCLNFNPLEAAQDKIKGCLGILNYNPRGKE